MVPTVRLRVRGPYACFTRPEFKAERVSYEIMTPSAARGILDAIHWKPSFRWVIDRIHVLAPINFTTISRNEVGSKISVRNCMRARTRDELDELHCDVEADRQQRSSLILKDVDYIIQAYPELLRGSHPSETIRKHIEMFKRRARRGQCFNTPYLGCREFSASFDLVEEATPITGLPDQDRNRDLGLMLHDIDYANHGEPRFIPAVLVDGVLDVSRAAARVCL
jgi:CRISPR-associated protein Cas5d